MSEPIIARIQKQIYSTVLGEAIDNVGQRRQHISLPSGLQFRAAPSAFDDLITDAAARYDLDASLVKAVVQAESNFAPAAVSHAGAKGLMQLMDGTAAALGVNNVFDPAENIDAGARYLRQMLDRFGGNEALALAAYNAGPNAVAKWGGVPPYAETQAYVPRVLGLRQQYNEWQA